MPTLNEIFDKRKIFLYQNDLLILSAGAGIVQCRKLYSSGSPDPAGKENQTISGSA